MNIKKDFLDLRKISSHVYIFLFSLIVSAFDFLIFKGIKNIGDVIEVFILLVVQIEAFILLSNLLFRKINETRTRKEFTRIILTRFLVYYILCFIASLIIFLIFLYFRYRFLGYDTSNLIHNFIYVEFSGWFLSIIIGLTIGALIFLVVQWQKALMNEQRLREENLIFQNETLRNQVNPHFLFNSLNTLSSLVNTHTEVAEQFIHRLSAIYRYITESSTKDLVPLNSELVFIRDYFYLHKIRDEEKIQLNIDVPSDVSYKILPVSLQMLIENAIKHNMATRESPLIIHVCIEDQHIVVKNNLQAKASKLQSTQTGLKNLSDRLRLTHGKELKIIQTENDYIVKVPLIL